MAGISFALPAIALFALKRRIQLDRALLGFASVPVCLSIGLLFAVLSGRAEDRAVSAVYNIYIWVGGICFLVLVRGDALRSFVNDNVGALYRRTRLVHAVAVLACGVPFALSILGVLSPETSVPTLFGLVNQDKVGGIMRFYSEIQLARPDFRFGESTVRFPGMGIYPTEGAFLIASWGLISIGMERFRRDRRSVVYALEIVTFLAVLLTASRNIVLAYVLGLVAMLLPSVGRGLGRYATAMLRICLVAVLLGWAVARPDWAIEPLSNAIMEARAGSAYNRLDSYAYAVQLTLAESPVIGLGIKPLDEALYKFPIGSHSSIISTFIKGGIIGLVLLLATFLMVSWPFFRSVMYGFGVLGETNGREIGVSKTFGRALLLAFAWCAAEDLDAPALGSLSFFAVVGTASAWVAFLYQRRRTRSGASWRGAVMVERSPSSASA